MKKKEELIKAQSISFTQEGDSIVFICKDGEGWLFAQQEFEGCCDYQATGQAVIVLTQSLQEMGYRF